MDDIAVIGVGLRFPGDASSPEELWQVLENGASQWSEFPKDRLNIDGYFHPGGDRQGSISFRGAHFLKGDMAAFDAPFFSIPAEDAKAIDPQQRYLLEVCYEALENAGIRKEDIDGSDTSVYVGSFVKDYEQICLRDPDWQPRYAATGNGIAIMANRISYFFNLHGPSMTIDTGCSGSLVSIHLAAQSLRTGESSLAIAAGAGMILTPNTIMPMTALNFLSPDGKCFTFDSRANGYGRGEGIGVVIMKRLSDALRDNDTIRAVIRGTNVNQDGRTTGITLPSKEAQVANIRSVYAKSGLDFNQTAYVECHGTGTQAGDWRELKAISETLGSCRTEDNPIIVGSVKPNIGHLEGAAGVAGLIKGVLMLERGKIPPNINFENGNPTIDFQSWKVAVPRALSEWPLPGVRRVSVNCFGFGGTNAHVIMDEAPAYLSSRGLPGNHSSIEAIRVSVNDDAVLEAPSNGIIADSSPQLFCYSGYEKPAVGRVMRSHVDYVKARSNGLAQDVLNDYAYTLGCRRSNLEWKGFVVASSTDELVSQIESFDSASAIRSSKQNRPRIAFTFSGQGSQWAEMGQDLMPFGVFRESIEQASSHMQNILGSTFNLMEELGKPESDSRISDPEISQPATTALQVALVELLDSFDIRPEQVVGHSSGEIAAAYAAGSISRQAAWEIAYYRGVAAASIPVRAPKLSGGMAVVGMSLTETEAYLDTVGKSAPAQIACINSPRSITISGRSSSIDYIANNLKQKKIFCRVLDVKTAYHSSHMKLVEHDYKDALKEITPVDSPSLVKMISSVTGAVVQGSQLDGTYWATNMVSPVQYVAAIEALIGLPFGERPNMIVELSPRGALRSPTLDIFAELALMSPPTYKSVLERKINGQTSVLNVIGSLWSRGYTVDIKGVVSRGASQSSLKSLTDLPPYPWNHTKSYWHESHLGEANRFRKYPRMDLIGAPTADSVTFEPRWRGFLRISENPWIQDHQVQKTIIYPAAGMVSMVLEGALQIVGSKDNLLGYEISGMHIEKAMIIPGTPHGLEVAMNMKTGGSGEGDDSQQSWTFSIYSKQQDRSWERHATGVLQIRRKVGNWSNDFHAHDKRYKEFHASCSESLVPRQLYEYLDTLGMNYGSLFQNIVEICKGDGSCVSKIRVPDTQSKMPHKFEYPHMVHPATLDSMFQTLLAIEPVPMVPTYIKSLFVSANIVGGDGQHFEGHSIANTSGIKNADATIVMKHSAAEGGYIVIDGLHLSAIAPTSPESGGFLPNHRNLCTEILWKEDAAFAQPSDLHEQISLLAHKYAGLSVLQIGGGFHLTEAVLKAVASGEDEAPSLQRLSIVDLPGDEGATQALSHVKNSKLESFVEKIEDVSQVFADYHVVIVSDDSGIEPESLKKHLKQSGIFLTLGSGPEAGQESEARDHAQGSLPDNALEQPHADHCVDGVTEKDQPTHDYKLLAELEKGQTHKREIFASRQVIVSKRTNPSNIVLLLPRASSDEVSGLVDGMTKLIEESEGQLTLLSISEDEATNNADLFADEYVISLLDFSGTGTRDCSVYEWDQSGFDLFHNLQTSSKGLLWITRGAHMKPLNPKGSPIVALARTLMSEDPLKQIVTFDLGSESRLEDKGVVQNILAVFTKSFVTKSAAPQEMEFAEEAGRLYIPRLTTISTLNQLVEDDDSRGRFVQKPFYTDDLSPLPSVGRKLTIAKPGLVDGGQYFTEFGRLAPKDDEVEISFVQGSLSYLDEDTVMGRTVDSLVGMDIRGIVKRIGANVSKFAPGDDVTALVSEGAIQDTVNVGARFVHKPKSGFVPSYYLSAFYALVEKGDVDPERKILIHAGASGFGLAAIKIAAALGQEVFATVLGEDVSQQREILEKHGLKSDHIFDASSEDHIGGILTATSGKGVDLVYNPTQLHIESNFKCVRKCGTIVQFSSKSPSPRPIQTPGGSVTFVNLDLRQLLVEEPKRMARFFEAVTRLHDESIAESPSLTEDAVQFPIDQFEAAIKHIQNSPYVGYVSLLANAGSEVSVFNETLTKPLHTALKTDGTYLLAGGLGGLGRSISELLISNGVRHLAFLSRSGASTESAKEFILSLQEKGIDARVYRVDICDEAALQDTIANQVTVEMPPISGVFQCAAVIKDAVFDNMVYEDWTAAFRPKTQGSWNLVHAIPAAGHDPFFIFLASSAGVIGNRGQANYAAGNFFEDALARHLRLQGKHAVSIDLGPVLGAGMLADDEDILDMLRASGFYGIRHGDFLKVVEHAITMETLPGVPMPGQVILGVGTGGIIRQNEPADPYWSRTALYSYLNLIDMPPPDLSLTSNATSLDVKTRLASSVGIEAASAIVCTGLSSMLAKAMNMLPEEVDVGKPPNAYGVDSLVAVGVRNWVLSNCGVQVSVFEVLSDQTITELSTMIAQKGGYGGE